jgi:hypothetical protein
MSVLNPFWLLLISNIIHFNRASESKTKILYSRLCRKPAYTDNSLAKPPQDQYRLARRRLLSTITANAGASCHSHQLSDSFPTAQEHLQYQLCYIHSIACYYLVRRPLLSSPCIGQTAHDQFGVLEAPAHQDIGPCKALHKIFLVE